MYLVKRLLYYQFFVFLTMLSHKYYCIPKVQHLIFIFYKVILLKYDFSLAYFLQSHSHRRVKLSQFKIVKR